MAATHFIRSNGVPCSQYIDDRHAGLPRACVKQFSIFQLAQMATFVACSVLVSLGYFIGLKKVSWRRVPLSGFWGILCDSEKQAFILPDDKRISFASLRESILEKNSVSLKNLEKFAGKTTSFSLLVPAAKLYTNCVFQVIAKTIEKGKLQVNLSPSLRKEISHLKFLDSWGGFLK